MNWIIENWSFLIIVVAAVICAVAYVKNFLALPTEDQIKNVKEWLIFATAEAEKELGGGTGKLKLRSVYDAFVAKFPSLAVRVPFDQFSLWVDSALDEMKRLIETNAAVQNYVNG